MLMPYDTTKTQWVNKDNWQYLAWYCIVSRVNWWDFNHCILQLNLKLLILVYDGLSMTGLILLVCSCTGVCFMISYAVILCDINSTLWQLNAMFDSLYPTDFMIIANIRSFSMWYLWYQLTLSNVWYNSEHVLLHTNQFKFPLSGMASIIVHRLSKDLLLKVYGGFWKLISVLTCNTCHILC